MMIAPTKAQKHCVRLMRKLSRKRGKIGAKATAEKRKRQKRLSFISATLAMSFPEVQETLQMSIAKTNRSSLRNFTDANAVARLSRRVNKFV